MLIKFCLFTLVFTATCFCRLSTVWVEYRSGGSDIVKKAEFVDANNTEKPSFRAEGRRVELNPRRLHYINVFPDTVEIYYGDTWCRVDIYPLTKDTTVTVHNGWMKLNTVLRGNADFGRLSASITELKQIHFKPKELLEATNAQ